MNHPKLLYQSAPNKSQRQQKGQQHLKELQQQKGQQLQSKQQQSLSYCMALPGKEGISQTGEYLFMKLHLISYIVKAQD